VLRDEDDDLIQISPSEQEIRNIFHQPFENIISLTNELTLLEKDLIPLIDIDNKPSLEIDYSYVDIENGSKEIDSYLLEAMKEPV